MKRKFIYTVLLLTIIIVSGCSTQIIKLVTLEDKDFYKGREIVTKENDFNKISVEVDSYSGDEVVFYVHVENNSQNKIYVEPRDFYVDAMNEDLISIDPRFPRFHSLDPEKQINRINEDIESRKTSHAVVTGLNATFALVSIVADLTDKSQENDASQVSRDIAVWADNQVNEEIDYDDSMSGYESEREFWKNEVLRITDLYENDSIGGLVFVPLSRKAEYLKLTVTIEDRTFTFHYKKVVVEK